MQDLRAVWAYIAQDDPKAATRLAERLLEAAEKLPDSPGLGRPGRVIDTRELVITRTPDLVPYRVIGNAVAVLRLLHGAQRWPERF